MHCHPDASGGPGLPATGGAPHRPPEDATEPGPVSPQRRGRARPGRYDSPGREHVGAARGPGVCLAAAGQHPSAAYMLPSGSQVVDAGRAVAAGADGCSVAGGPCVAAAGVGAGRIAAPPARRSRKGGGA